MQDLEAERNWVRQLVAQALGQNPGMPRQLAGEMRGGGLESDLLALPMVIMAPMQDEDGNFLFMVDDSPVDGEEPIG